MAVELVGCKILPAIFSLYADLQTSCLSISQIGAASYLKVFLLTRRPCLNVTRFHFQICQITGTALQGTNRNIQTAEQIHRILPELVIPCFGFFRLTYHNHLLLLDRKSVV